MPQACLSLHKERLSKQETWRLRTLQLLPLNHWGFKLSPTGETAQSGKHMLSDVSPTWKSAATLISQGVAAACNPFASSSAQPASTHACNMRMQHHASFSLLGSTRGKVPCACLPCACNRGHANKFWITEHATFQNSNSNRPIDGSRSHLFCDSLQFWLLIVYFFV